MMKLILIFLAVFTVGSSVFANDVVETKTVEAVDYTPFEGPDEFLTWMKAYQCQYQKLTFNNKVEFKLVAVSEEVDNDDWVSVEVSNSDLPLKKGYKKETINNYGNTKIVTYDIDDRGNGYLSVSYNRDNVKTESQKMQVFERLRLYIDPTGEKVSRAIGGKYRVQMKKDYTEELIWSLVCNFE